MHGVFCSHSRRQDHRHTPLLITASPPPAELSLKNPTLLTLCFCSSGAGCRLPSSLHCTEDSLLNGGSGDPARKLANQKQFRSEPLPSLRQARMDPFLTVVSRFPRLSTRNNGTVTNDGAGAAATARMFHFAKWWSWATYIHSRYPPADNTVALRPKHKERALESWLRQILTRLVEWRSSSVFSPRTILSRYGAKWVPWFRPPQALPARLTFGSTRSRSHISKRPPISFPRSRLSDGC